MPQAPTQSGHISVTAIGGTVESAEIFYPLENVILNYDGIGSHVWGDCSFVVADGSSAPYVSNGTAWQWTWFVPHDVEGLVNLMGGEDAFVQKLDSLFSADSSLEGETTSSDISGLIGQYAHGNEPSHHVIHLYNYVNRPWRTQELVDSVYRSQYANSIDGLSGNEDCGQMSAWYILNSMGFYQVCPGKPVYSIGRPAFDKAVINLPEEKTFSIVVKNNGKKNKYIESVSLNGKALNIPFFNHQDIANGGTMEIKMTDHPTKWGVLSPALSSKKEE